MPIIDFDSECWADPWVQQLPPVAKLLFIYLWTNVHRNISGMYMITRETIAFETGLTKKQIDDLWQVLYPKVEYDPAHSICWVVKHTRRQFLRGDKIAPKQREGIRRHALKLKWHPFFKLFVEAYPEIFLKEELKDILTENETLSKGIETLSKGIDTLGGKGGGKGKSNSLKDKGVQGEKETFFKEFWELYPPRDGKKVLKQEAQKFFLKNIKDEEVGAVLQAVRNYSISKTVTDGYARDAIRFLKKDYWRNWVEISPSISQGSFRGAKLWLEAKEKENERGKSKPLCLVHGKTEGDLSDSPHA